MLKQLSIVLLTAPAVVDAFSASNSQRTHRSALSSTNGNGDECLPNVVRNVAAASAVALALIMPSSVFAQDTLHQQSVIDNGIYSSTVTLSDVIKTMDFSLPTSYDSISDPIASGVDELTTSSVKTAAKKVEKKKEPKKRSTSANKGISLPSFGGGGGEKPTIDSDAFKPKSAEEKAAVLAARRAEREEAALAVVREKAEAERQAALEREANIKAARLEKIAKREEEAAKKAAEESAKRNEMSKEFGVSE